jgi:hypothetical protein
MSKITKVSVKKSKTKRNEAVSRMRKNDKFKIVDSPVDQLSHLQRTIGNQSVQRLFKSGTLQTKLKIGKPNDKYELEADRVADQVMRMPEPKISRQTEEREEEELVQSKPISEQIAPLIQRQAESEEEEEEIEGEHPEDIEEQITFCTSTASNHSDILKLLLKFKQPEPVGTLMYGYTAWSPKKSATFPKLDIGWTASGKKWVGKVKPTKAAMGKMTILHLKAGTYKIHKKKITARFPQCGPKGKKVPFFSKVDDDMSTLAESAEKEHCKDYQRVFELTLKKWADIINSITGKTFGPDTKTKVKKQIHDNLKKKGNKTRDQWIKELNRLNKLSLIRDTLGWHSLKPDGKPITCPPDCSKLTGITVKSSLTKIPGKSSKDLIK